MSVSSTYCTSGGVAQKGIEVRKIITNLRCDAYDTLVQMTKCHSYVKYSPVTYPSEAEHS